jgi:hypothetical protein
VGLVKQRISPRWSIDGVWPRVPELAAALDTLMQRIDKSAKPTAQSSAARCEQMRRVTAI